MARLTEEGIALRWRLCGHLRRLYEEHDFDTKQAMAERLGVHKSHFGNLYNGVAEIGLDVAWKMHRVFGDSLNHLCDDKPDDRFMVSRDRFLAEHARPGPRKASRTKQ
jgi:hypothetical protein